MTIKLSAAPGSLGAGLSRAQVAMLAAVGVVGLGGTGGLVYHVVSKPAVAAPAPASLQEVKLAERVDERRSRAEADAKRLKQQELGQGYRFDGQGNLVSAAADTTDLPQNKFGLVDTPPAPSTPEPVTTAIGRGIERTNRDAEYDDELGDEPTRRRGATAAGEQRDEGGGGGEGRGVTLGSMLGYSTVPGATWAARRPERGVATGSGSGRPGEGERGRSGESAIEKATAAAEDSSRLLDQAIRGKGRDETGDVSAQPRSGLGPGGGSGYWGPGPQNSHGPAGAGEALYAEEKPATRGPQAFATGAVGDMTIGGGVGPDQVVRQGKFLDCVVVNQIRADLVDSPVIAMVARDFISLDGKYVLVPAGSKLLGEAGRVQNLQQVRVYIKFERIIFPDQRSAYFPSRKVPAVDEIGAVGVEGDVDRHLVLQFGAAVMLGVLDGIGAAVQSPTAAATPTIRDLVMARTSTNFSTVLAGVVEKYANVVPTVTVASGSKMKVFFAEDVRLSPYGRSADLPWMHEER